MYLHYSFPPSRKDLIDEFWFFFDLSLLVSICFCVLAAIIVTRYLLYTHDTPNLHQLPRRARRQRRLRRGVTPRRDRQRWAGNSQTFIMMRHLIYQQNTETTPVALWQGHQSGNVPRALRLTLLVYTEQAAVALWAEITYHYWETASGFGRRALGWSILPRPRGSELFSAQETLQGVTHNAQTLQRARPSPRSAPGQRLSCGPPTPIEWPEEVPLAAFSYLNELAGLFLTQTVSPLMLPLALPLPLPETPPPAPVSLPPSLPEPEPSGPSGPHTDEISAIATIQDSPASARPLAGVNESTPHAQKLEDPPVFEEPELDPPPRSSPQKKGCAGDSSESSDSFWEELSDNALRVRRRPQIPRRRPPGRERFTLSEREPMRRENRLRRVLRQVFCCVCCKTDAE